jgi:ethanolaminephosphotransferase
MNEAGNHGGNEAGETEATLLFASPKFRTMSTKEQYECPTLPTEGTRFDYYNAVEQQDVVPTLSGLMGLPIPRNSIGKPLSTLRGMWSTDEAYINFLESNARQLWNIAEKVFGSAALIVREQTRTAARNQTTHQTSCVDYTVVAKRLACLLSAAEQQTRNSRDTQRWSEARIAYEEFLTQAQQALIKENQSFSVLRMASGIFLCAAATALCWYSVGAFRPSGKTSMLFALAALSYAANLLTSTTERSEQYFWYTSSAVWLVSLAVKSAGDARDTHDRSRILRACIAMLAIHCVAVSWTSVGTFAQQRLSAYGTWLLWFRVLAVYGWNARNLVQHTFADVLTRGAATTLVTPLLTTAFLFKISHELEQSYATAMPVSLDQVFHFRAFLVLLALVTSLVCLMIVRRKSTLDGQASTTESVLSSGLHHLLTLFLITQSKSENSLLFIAWNISANVSRQYFAPIRHHLNGISVPISLPSTLPPPSLCSRTHTSSASVAQTPSRASTSVMPTMGSRTTTSSP